MLYLISGIIILGIAIATANYIGNRRREWLFKNGKIEAIEEDTHADTQSDCCGKHEVCERDSLMAAVSKGIEYYDDEELDIYIGTGSNAYSESAIEEFRDVLYTLREEEVAGWLRSLQLREINLPDTLKDAAILIVEERRHTH